MRRGSAMATAGILTASLVTAAPTGAGAAAPSGPIARLQATYKCGNPGLAAAKAICALLTVPLDHAKPKGTTIQLGVAVINHRSSAADYLGVLVVNPGGPGAQGAPYAARVAQLLGDIGGRFDIVGLDLRGVGFSKPRMSCNPSYRTGPRPDHEPTTGVTGAVSPPEKAWLKKVKAYATACGKAYPDLLKHATTLDAARDLELLRIALGVPKLSYYGASYGTYLGQVYATRYPGRVGRMILDGVVDPADVWYSTAFARVVGLQRSIGPFWQWVADNDAAYHLGTTASAVHKRYVSESRKLRTKPVGHVGTSEWNYIFGEAAYGRAMWPAIAEGFRLWLAGKPAKLTARWMTSEGPDTSTAAYLAPTCTDAPWPRDYATWRKKAFATAKTAPFVAWTLVWHNAPCLFWPAPARTPVKVGSSKTPGILMLTAELDGATSYSDAVAVRDRFPSSRLIVEVRDTTHTVLALGNTCVDSRVRAYLLRGDLPKRISGQRADIGCTPVPAPEP